MAKKKKKTDSSAWRLQIVGICAALSSVVLLNTTILLLVGMVPTFVAFFVDRSKSKTKTLTVGAMNLAGCMPFVMELWTHGNSFEKAVHIAASPQAICVMYAAAGIGYMIDWVLVGAIASFLFKRGEARLQEIAELQAKLIERWGREVTGDMPLDEHGFPIADQGGNRSSGNGAASVKTR